MAEEPSLSYYLPFSLSYYLLFMEGELLDSYLSQGY